MSTIRTILGAVLLSGGALSAASMAETAPATPRQTSQAPGFYRIPLGEVKVTALSDGTVTIPVDKLLTGATPAHVDQVLASHHLAPRVETSINAFLVDTGKRLVLIDTGAGASFGPHAGGRLLDSIRAAGYRPEDIDTVLLTHIHGDHSDGLTVNGKAQFPNAEVVVEWRDAGLWLDESKRASVAEQHRHVFDEARAAFAPYLAAGRVKTFAAGADPVPGIHSLDASGHTPGHTMYEVSGGGKTLRFIGDLVHVKDVQFAEPQLTMRFDVDPAAARHVRETVFRDAATQGFIVAGAHIPFPGVGYVERSGKTYVWAPLNYSALQ